MPYISTERVAEIRKQLKATFPGIKFSVRRHHHSTVCVSIMESPYTWPEGTQQLNPYYLSKYEHAPFLEKIKSIANAGNYIVSEDGDYGSIPKFYFDIEIGRWDRPHVTRKGPLPDLGPEYRTEPDWPSGFRAWLEGEEEEGACGFGATPQEAIEDLKIALDG